MAVTMSDAVKAELKKYTGKCVDGEHLVQGEKNANFSYDEIFQLMDGYLNRSNDPRLDYAVSSYHFIHMSEQNTGGDDASLLGSVCMKDQGATANRAFADWVKANCTGVLGEGAKEKCVALQKTADFYSEKPFLEKAAEWIFEKAAGALEMFAIFGPALYLYHRRQQNKDNNNNKKSGGTGGVGGGGDKFYGANESSRAFDEVSDEMSMLPTTPAEILAQMIAESPIVVPAVVQAAPAAASPSPAQAFLNKRLAVMSDIVVDDAAVAAGQVQATSSAAYVESPLVADVPEVVTSIDWFGVNSAAEVFAAEIMAGAAAFAGAAKNAADAINLRSQAVKFRLPTIEFRPQVRVFAY